jgi:hypothetical protein
MAKLTKKSESTKVRVLPASEYPAVITAPRGAYARSLK